MQHQNGARAGNRALSWAVSLILAVAVALAGMPLVLPGVTAVAAAEDGSELTVAINEVESSDADDGPDWVELYNYGDEAVDVSGWYVLDDDSSHTAQPLADGTTIEAGGLLVLEDGTDFDCGLGKSDTVTLYDADGNVVDEYSWSGHADGTYQRIPDGTGDFVDAEPTKGELNCPVFINEIESKDADGGNDWVEIINIGSSAVDVSGWYILDNDPEGHADETTPLADGTTLEAGAVLVLEEGTDFDFGLGGEDTATLYNADGVAVDTYSWTSHASGTYSRVPDGTGDFVDQDPTKGELNSTSEEGEEEAAKTVAINEVESSDADDGPDWVEIYNYGDEAVDISGWYILDSDGEDHLSETTPLADGTTLEAGAVLVLEEGTDFDFGLGKSDTVSLYDADGNLVDEYSWSGHADGTYQRVPDGTGDFVDAEPTKGELNSAAEEEEEEASYTVAINEVNSAPDDWVEIYNYGDEAVDISGWYILDNDPEGNADKTTPLADGTTLEAGAFYVFVQNTDFTFGIGSEDAITLYDADGNAIDTVSWTEHASYNGDAAQASLGRYPDGTGDFTITKETQGEANAVYSSAAGLVLNEIYYVGDASTDWVELYNPTDEAIDLSGVVISGTNGSYTFDGTSIEAGAFLVVKVDFDLADADTLTITQDGEELASASWTEQVETSLGLYPDVDGSIYLETSEVTKGYANVFNDADWPGADSVTTVTDLSFLEDSSGLDFADGKLYAVDNGTGTFWVIEVTENDDGTLSYSYASTFDEDGKQVVFQADADDADAAGPDAEGITVDASGNVYFAVERDNSDKGTNYDVILMLTADQVGSDSTSLVATYEWDLTDILPSVSANMGIEAVEWVSFDDVKGNLYDENTGATFDPSNYSNAVGGGVFFVALEDNGHVYAFVLNEDETATLIADIDTELGHAMALDYDTANDVLWVVTDDAVSSVAVVISFDEGTTSIIHVQPSDGATALVNSEGFAIADVSYTTDDGLRPCFYFVDGATSGQLSVGYLYCNYMALLTDEDGTEEGGHSYGEGVVTEATCTEDGETTYTCTVCGGTRTETIDATGHSLTYVEATDATCAEDGNIAHWACESCGKLFSDEEGTAEVSGDDVAVAATGEHSWDGGAVTEAAWDGAEGTVTYTCSVCGGTVTEAFSYVIEEGAGQTVSRGEDMTVTSDSTLGDGYGKFTGLEVDGEGLEAGTDYTYEEGSVVATVGSAYLDALDAGEHGLTFVYEDGSVSTTFTISDDGAAASDGAAEEAGSGDGLAGTGDGAALAVAGVAAVGAVALAAGIAVSRRRGA